MAGLPAVARSTTQENEFSYKQLQTVSSGVSGNVLLAWKVEFSAEGHAPWVTVTDD